MNEIIINGIIERSQEVSGEMRYAVGAPGADGVGISDIFKTSTVGNIDTYTIFLTDGTTKTFTVTNGIENIDQTYSPTSENAQSGIAVKQAVDGVNTRVNNEFTNALKGSKSGSAILIDDVSPVTHEMGIKVSSKNLIPYPFTFESITSYGITFTDNKNGTITLNGQLNDNTTPATYVLFANTNIDKLGLKPNTYYHLSCSDSNLTISLRTVKTDGTNKFYSYGNIKFSSEETPDRLFLQVKKDDTRTFENIVISIQLELGSTATAYTPYISDLTAVNVTEYGKNLFSLANRAWANFGATPNTTVRNINKDNFYFQVSSNNYVNNSKRGYEIVNGNTIKITGVQHAYGLGVPFHLIAGQQYTISCIRDNEKSRMRVSYYDVNGNHLSEFIDLPGSFTVPENAYWTMILFIAYNPVGASSGELTFSNIQLELGTTVTEYEPYKECAEHTSTEDGVVNGVTSLYPVTTLMTDTEGVLIDCEYNRDINKAFAALEAAIATNNS